MEQMTDIQQLLGGGTSSTAKPDPNKLGQDQFLELFVAQLKNQDPTSPMESGDFLTQIAQFSMASGVSELQQGFESLSAIMQQDKLSDASAMLSRQVLHDTSAFVLGDGDTATVSAQVSLSAHATEVNVHIRDANGFAITTLNLGAQQPGEKNIAWNGEIEPGERAPAGSYTVAVTAVIDGVERSVPAYAYNQVESVKIDPQNGGVVLLLDSGEQIELSDVKEFKS